MGNAIFIHSDVALAHLGASATASETDTGYAAASIVEPSRRVYWRTAASPGASPSLTIDLGSAKPISGFAVCYVTSSAGAGAHPVMSLRSADTSPGTVERAAQTAAYWNTTKDWAAIIAGGPITARYWTLACSGVGARFGVGKIILGTGVDIGHLYSQGSGYTYEQASARVRTASQMPIDMPMGDPRRLFSWNFRSNTTAEKTVFDGIASQSYPFAVVDGEGASHHVVLAESRGVQYTHVFMDLWDVTLAMEQMP